MSNTISNFEGGKEFSPEQGGQIYERQNIVYVATLAVEAACTAMGLGED